MVISPSIVAASTDDWGVHGWGSSANIATAIGAIIAITAVIVNIFFLIALLRQIKIGREALNESKEANKAAYNAVVETERSRIDAQAPRLSINLEPYFLGPVVDGTSQEFVTNEEFILPRDSNKRIFVNVEGTITNEGRSTAKLTLNINNGAFVARDDDELWLGGPTGVLLSDYTLLPKESVKFRWSDSHTVIEWADATANPAPPNPNGACFGEIISKDSYESGVFDYAFLEMSGRIIVPVDGDDSHWRFNDGKDFVAICYPIRRVYKKDYPDKRPAPSLPQYEKWNLTKLPPSSTPRIE